MGECRGHCEGAKDGKRDAGLVLSTRHSPLFTRQCLRVHLIVTRQPDPKRWNLSRLAMSPAADEAVLTEQSLEGWAANLDAEDR